MDLFGIFAIPLSYLLEFIYGIVGNYGITLIILTIIVKGCLYPLYAKQIKSTADMQAVQPKLKEIQTRYADDKELMNEKMTELYKEENFNPLGGCLPMLIQMPIIMGLFTLLRNPMKYMPDEKMLFAIHESFLWIKDLSQPDLWVLPILAGIATYFSFSMTQKLTTTTTSGTGMQGQSMQNVMKYFFPISILWLARSYPAGLAIYWAGSQFIQIFYNIRMNRLRKEIKEKQELIKKRELAEKELQKRKKARMKGI